MKVVRLAQELGLARLGKLSIDGTKVRANASKHKAMSYDRMQEEEQRLESEVEALVRQAEAVDEAEDARLGVEVRGDDLPAELRGGRSVWPRFARRRRVWKRSNGRRTTRGVGNRARTGTRRAVRRTSVRMASRTTRRRATSRNPESSIMKTSSEGFQQCYNAQAAVDAEHQLVVATDLTANASDQGELPVLLDAVQETFDAQPETVLADAAVLQRAGPGRTWKNGALTLAQSSILTAGVIRPGPKE